MTSTTPAPAWTAADNAHAFELAAAGQPLPRDLLERADRQTREVLADAQQRAREAQDAAARARGGSEPSQARRRRQPRRKRELTPEEKTVREERRVHKRQMRGALEALSPALVADGDTLRDEGVIDISHAREVRPLLHLPRRSGRGAPGSALLLRACDYDGHNGGAAGPYVLVCTEFHDGHGYRCRTRGVAIRAADLRQVIDALAAEADRLDAGDAGEAEAAKPSRPRRKRPRSKPVASSRFDR